MKNGFGFDAEVIVSSDTTALNPGGLGLYVGSTGTVVIKNFYGSNVTFVGVPAGAELRCYVAQVLETGTDATDFVVYR